MRRFIRNNRFLYPLYVRRVYLNRRAVFPCKETQLHLTGFQRSANTYCYNIVSTALPELKLSTHIHTTASLKLAKYYEVPTILLLRDPFATCGSWFLKGKIDPQSSDIERVLLDYIEYHRYALAEVDSWNVVSFQNAISSPEYILHYVVKMLGLSMDKAAVEEGAIAGQKVVEDKERTKKPEGGSLPNKDRTRRKEQLRDRFNAAVSYNEAHRLYRKLLEREKALSDL